MADRVVLHIGLPKTGTTYLQKVLWSNKAVLARDGLLMPGANHRQHLLASLDLRENPRLARRAGKGAAPWRDLVEEVNGWSGQAVISHEFFGSASVEQAGRAVTAFGEADVHVVVTARAMVDLGISRWQEWVRNGGVEDIDSFPRSNAYDPTDDWGWGSTDLAEVLSRWGAAVPHHHLHVLPVKPGASPASNLWERFASVLQVDPASVVAPPQERNRSLGLVETEVLRRVNRHLTGFRAAWDRGHWIRHVLAEQVLGQITDGERFRPGDQTLHVLQERGRRGIDVLVHGDFDVVGDVDHLEPSDVQGWRHPSEVGDDELLAASVRANALLLERVRAISRECNALRDAGVARRGRRRLAQLMGWRSERATEGENT